MSDFDRELVREILRQIYRATATILKRFQSIDTVDDFLNSDDGLLRLDGICMQLIAIGESVKNPWGRRAKYPSKFLAAYTSRKGQW